MIQIDQINIYSVNDIPANLLGNPRLYSRYTKSINASDITKCRSTLEFSLSVPDNMNYYVDSSATSLYGEQLNIISMKEFGIQKNEFDLKNIKNYMFIPLTTCDRDWFSRKFPNLKKVIKPNKADIIFYDKDSISKIINLKADSYNEYENCPRIYNSYYGNYHTVTETLNNKTILNIYYTPNVDLCDNNNYMVYKIPKLDLSYYKDKLININEFMNKFDGKSAELVMSKDDLFEFFKQATSDSLDIARLAVNTVCGYPEKYMMIKFIIMYWAHKKFKSQIKLSKTAMYYNRFERFFDSNHEYRYKTSAENHIKYMSAGFNKIAEDIKDCEYDLLLDILNSNLLAQKLFESTNYSPIKFKAVFSFNGLQNDKD